MTEAESSLSGAKPVWLTESQEGYVWTIGGTDFLGALLRGPNGQWCGYVGIPKTHPWWGKDYSLPVPVPESFLFHRISVNDVGPVTMLCFHLEDTPDGPMAPPALLLRCHMGLTWGRGELPQALGAKEAPKGLWWFGFDCGHCEDLLPGAPRAWAKGLTYRTEAYTKKKVLLLASDLKEAQDSLAAQALLKKEKPQE